MRFLFLLVFVSCLPTAMAVAPVLPLEPVLHELAGRVVVGRQRLGERVDVGETIIFFRPSEPVAVAAIAERVEMRMAGKAFTPGVVAVTQGTTVHFPNLDPILHNAFSTSSSNAFDLDFYGAGESREVVFTEAGLVRVFCNVHHGMAGYVMVLDTPYFTRPDSQGRFRLDVPAGMAGRLYVWHPQARVEQRDITAKEPAFMEFSLDINGRRVPRHLNKHGKPYRRHTGESY